MTQIKGIRDSSGNILCFTVGFELVDMYNKELTWLKTARDDEPEFANIFTGRAIEIVLLAFLPPWLWFGIMSFVQLIKAFLKLSHEPIAGPLAYITISSLLLLYGTTRASFAESIRLFYGVFEKSMRMISSIAVGVLEVSARRPLTARLTAVVLFIFVMVLGFLLYCQAFFPRNIFASLFSPPGQNQGALLQRLGDIYTVALLGCFSVFAVEITVSDKWWLTFFRVATVADCDTVPPPQEDETADALLIAHVSDLHAVARGRCLIEEPKRHVSAGKLDALLSSIVRDQNVEAIVCSGDLTDDGSVGAWAQLFSLPSWETARERLIIAPGNHDLNYAEAGVFKSLFRIEHRAKRGLHLRALRFLRVADLVMGDRATLISPFTGGLTTLREAMERMKPDFDSWGAKQKNFKSAMHPCEFLEKCFPMVVTTEIAKNKCAFLVWNTVKNNSVPVWNAVGEIATEQIDRAKDLLRQLPASMPIVHVMHHQVTLPKAKTFRVAVKRGLGIGMVLNSSHRFFNWVAKLRQSTVLLHGHHHKAFWCTNTDRSVGIVSAPSGTLGCEESFFDQLPSKTKDPHWLRLNIALKGANARVARVTPVRVPPEDEASVKTAETEAFGC